MTVTELWDNHFSTMVRYGKGIEKYRLLKSVPRDFQSDVQMWYGPSDVGKSHQLKLMFPPAEMDKYYWASNGKWFDDYDGQDVVVCDEIDGSWMPYRNMKQFLGDVPYRVETKGGMRNFAPKKIILISNTHPSLWYTQEVTHCTWDRSPLKKRIRFMIFCYSQEIWIRDHGLPILNDLEGFPEVNF